MPEFSPVANATPSIGLVLRLGQTEPHYMRVTHIFGGSIYFMTVKEPVEARQARRPFRLSLADLRKLTDADATWGRVILPPSLSNVSLLNPKHEQDIEAAWFLIEPLVAAFDQEENLHHSNFSALIQARADATGSSVTTVRRTLFRFYYFGRSRLGLLDLPSGTKPKTPAYPIQQSNDNDQVLPRRRGRKSVLSTEHGPNNFLVSQLDINDMVECLKRCLSRGPTSLAAAHEDYLANDFRRRHPQLAAQYLEGKHLEPVTQRQFRYYIENHARLSADLEANLRLHTRELGQIGSLYAAGPGEVYEIDSTGGRLYLVARNEDGTSVIVGKPTIYLIVDRWSRFVVSVYISLRPPSYEEVRHTLLVAFTSRERRFSTLGVNVDDVTWPVGRMPAVLCPDRGSEFLSSSMEQAVVNDLRIELTPLPPYCPDGKAIVERLIREVKRRMAQSGLKGTYADRPLDPQTKRVAKKAELVAIHSLAEAYRTLIEIVVEHNNRPHTALRRNRALTQADVSPTPKEAYLWGLKNVTGLQVPPFDDEDYRKLLLASDRASISNGILRYKKRAYLPSNEAAIEIASNSTRRAKQIEIRVDKTDPLEIFIVNHRGIWASFHITHGGEGEISGLTLDEEDALATKNALLWARSEHQSRLERVSAKSQNRKKKITGSGPAASVEKNEKISLREKETANLKEHLIGDTFEHRSVSENNEVAGDSDWRRYEEQERLRNLDAIRKHRDKQ